MYRLLRGEIRYNRILYQTSLFLTLLFAAAMLLNPAFLEDVSFLNNTFWSVAVGITSFFIFQIIWSMQIKEKRDYQIALKPAFKTDAVSAKFLSLLIPLYLPSITVLLLIPFVDKTLNETVEAVHVQLSLLFIFTVLMISAKEIWDYHSEKNDNAKILSTAAVMLPMVIMTGGVLYATLFGDYLQLAGYPGLPVFIWGNILLLVPAYFYNRKRSYLPK